MSNLINNYDLLKKTTTVTNTTFVTAEKTTEQTEQASAQTERVDGFVKQQYTPDMEKVNEMKTELKGNVSAFRSMVQSLATKQGNLASTAAGFSLKNIFENLQVDEATRAEAQEAISEDGDWGVEAVAQRLVDFAKAISGGDPSKIEMLRDAVSQGFGEAEKAWGGEMPEITAKTYERTNELFDQWANGGAEESEEAAEQAE